MEESSGSNAYFEIEGRRYPFPESFRLVDPVLVEEVAGLKWDDFVDRIEDAGDDPAVMAGMVAVAFWQGNPRVRRDKIVQHIQQLDMEHVKVHVEEDVPVPPAEPGESPEKESAISDVSAPASSEAVAA